MIGRYKIQIISLFILQYYGLSKVSFALFGRMSSEPTMLQQVNNAVTQLHI
jgi:hypothetical protein